MRRYSAPWYAVLSAYWFATSFKWTLVLFVLLPARVAELVDPAEKAYRLGLLFGLGAVMATLGPPIWGYISDRFPTAYGRRMPYLAVGSVLTAGALALMALAPSYPLLFLGYLLLQVSDDLATGPYSALIPDLVPKARRGVASGWMGGLQALAQIAAGVAGFLGQSLAALFFLVALLNLLAAGLTLAYVREPKGVPPRQEGLWESLRLPWRDPDFRWVWSTRFLVMLGQYLVQTYLQYYLDDVVRVFSVFGRVIASRAYQAAGLLVLFISAGAVLSSVPAGRMSDRLGRKRIVYVSGGFLTLAIVPLLLFPRFDLLLPLALVFGAAYGAYAAVDWALVSDVLRKPENHATDMGVWQTSIVLPQIVAGMFGGGVDALNRAQPGQGYTAAFVVAGLAFLLGSVLVSRIRGVR